MIGAKVNPIPDISGDVGQMIPFSASATRQAAPNHAWQDKSALEEGSAPVTSEQMAPMTGEAMAPVTSKEMAPVTGEQMAPGTSGEMAPAPMEGLTWNDNQWNLSGCQTYRSDEYQLQELRGTLPPKKRSCLRELATQSATEKAEPMVGRQTPILNSRQQWQIYEGKEYRLIFMGCADAFL